MLEIVSANFALYDHFVRGSLGVVWEAGGGELANTASPECLFSQTSRRSAALRLSYPYDCQIRLEPVLPAGTVKVCKGKVGGLFDWGSVCVGGFPGRGGGFSDRLCVFPGTVEVAQQA